VSVCGVLLCLGVCGVCNLKIIIRIWNWTVDKILFHTRIPDYLTSVRRQPRHYTLLNSVADSKMLTHQKQEDEQQLRASSNEVLEPQANTHSAIGVGLDLCEYPTKIGEIEMSQSLHLYSACKFRMLKRRHRCHCTRKVPHDTNPLEDREAVRAQ
jgi:hypothetical protein